MPSNKDKNKSHELDETLKRLGQHSGVMGTIVVNSEGKQVNISMPPLILQNITSLLVCPSGHLSY